MKRRGQPSTSSKKSSSPNWFAGFPWLLFKRCFGLALYPLEKKLMKRRSQRSTSSKKSSSPNWFAGFPWLLFKRCFGLALYPLEKIDEAARSAKYIFKKIMLPKLICRVPVVTLQKMFWFCTVPLRKKWWSGEVSETHLKKNHPPQIDLQDSRGYSSKDVSVLGGYSEWNRSRDFWKWADLPLETWTSNILSNLHENIVGNTENTYIPSKLLQVHGQHYASFTAKETHYVKIKQFSPSGSLEDALVPILGTLVKLLAYLVDEVGLSCPSDINRKFWQFSRGIELTILPLMTMCQYPCMVTKFK